MALPWNNLQFTDSLSLTVCWKCGVRYGVPTSLHESCRKHGHLICCPNGHRNQIPGLEKASDAKLRELHEQEQREAREAEHRDQRKPDGPPELTLRERVQSSPAFRAAEEQAKGETPHDLRPIDLRKPCVYCGKAYKLTTGHERHLRKSHGLTGAEIVRSINMACERQSDAA